MAPVSTNEIAVTVCAAGPAQTELICIIYDLVSYMRHCGTLILHWFYKAFLGLSWSGNTLASLGQGNDADL